MAFKLDESRATQATDVLALQAWVIASGMRYWPGATSRHIEAIAMHHTSWNPSRECELVPVPDWAADVGVGSPPALLVDRASIKPGSGSKFDRCNWFCAAFLFLSGEQERRGEAASYATSLTDTDPRLFERAWVNRIFLLLRRLAAHNARTSEEILFGSLPAAVFHVTHDVDALCKTPEIRFKQTAFHIFNAGVALAKGRWAIAAEKFVQAIRFLLTTPDYWNFANVRAVEAEHGVRSTFNFYGGPSGWKRKSLRKLLIDPGYDIAEPRLRNELNRLLEGGWSIGVHPSFASWDSPDLMRQERAAVTTASGAAATECRQHWLRFSWTKTWETQVAAGFTLDTTLGFNNRPGFRNGAALRFRPWHEATKRALPIEALPMLLMDSHFYDYAMLTGNERRAELLYWISEVRAVGGEVSVNWHVHTLAPDYGWEQGFKELLQIIAPLQGAS